ncbi:MAG: flagellar motor protein MotB [Pseudomonadota bacterium]
MSEAIEDAPGGDDEGGGVPAWVMTFADLMTLLMCFFVLLLAFSEMDVLKFKQLSGSVREAFGVQAQIEAKTIPKGTSIIAQEFSPGIPEPTPLVVVQQHTTDTQENSLDFEADDEIETNERRKERESTPEQIAENLKAKLGQEIAENKVDVRVEGRRVVIELREKATFASGAAQMAPEFVPVLGKIAEILDTTPGSINVSGHSDNVPIRSNRFRSNWDLSSARAVTVLDSLLRQADLSPARFTASGHADTRPLLPNTSPSNRARNRRVEISIVQRPDADPQVIDPLLLGSPLVEELPEGAAGVP